MKFPAVVFAVSLALTEAAVIAKVREALDIPHADKLGDNAVIGGEVDRPAHDHGHEGDKAVIGGEFDRPAKDRGHEGSLKSRGEKELHEKKEHAAGEEARVHSLELAYAGCLMGGVALVMSLFYLVNYPKDEIRQSTWQVLNMTVSIFCAVLIYGLIREVCGKLMALGEGAPFPTSMTVALFIFTYFLFQATLCLCALAVGWGTKAAGGLFAHIAGFAASFLTAETQFMEPIKHSVALTFLVALGSGLGLSALNWCACQVRQKVIQWDGKKDEAEEEWEDVVEDAEQDVLALTMGFALMQAFRFLVVGESQPFEPDEAPEDIRQWETNALLCCGVLFALLVGLASVFNATHREKFTKGSLLRHFVDAQPSVMSMGMAWSLLFWGEWQVYCLGFKGVRIAGCLCVALLMSLLGVASVFGLDRIASVWKDAEASKLAIPQLVLAVGLLVGFAWERCFDMGLDTISELHGPYAHIITHALQVGLLVIVVPAWSKYVQPKAAG